MRKKTVNHVVDTIFGHLLYFLPIICYLLFMLAEPSSGVVTLTDFSSFMTSTGFGVLTNNILFTTLESIFGANGILPVFAGSAVSAYLTYFIVVYLAHVCVDMLLLLPRIAHNWMNKLSKGE